MTNKELHSITKNRLKEFCSENSFSLKSQTTLLKKKKYKDFEQFIHIPIASYGLVHRISCPDAIVSFVELERLLEPFNQDLFFGNNPLNQKPFTHSIKKFHLRFDNVPKSIRDIGEDDGLTLRVKNLDGLNLGLDLLIQTLKQQILPFFETVNSLEGFNAYLESINWIDKIKPNETNPFTMIKWLLVKRLIHDCDFNRLKENRLLWLETILEEDKVGNLPYYNAYLKYFDFLENL